MDSRQTATRQHLRLNPLTSKTLVPPVLPMARVRTEIIVDVRVKAKDQG